MQPGLEWCLRCGCECCLSRLVRGRLIESLTSPASPREHRTHSVYPRSSKVGMVKALSALQWEWGGMALTDWIPGNIKKPLWCQQGVRWLIKDQTRQGTPQWIPEGQRVTPPTPWCYVSLSEIRCNWKEKAEGNRPRNNQWNLEFAEFFLNCPSLSSSEQD